MESRPSRRTSTPKRSKLPPLKSDSSTIKMSQKSSKAAHKRKPPQTIRQHESSRSHSPQYESSRSHSPQHASSRSHSPQHERYSSTNRYHHKGPPQRQRERHSSTYSRHRVSSSEDRKSRHRKSRSSRHYKPRRYEQRSYSSTDSEYYTGSDRRREVLRNQPSTSQEANLRELQLLRELQRKTTLIEQLQSQQLVEMQPSQTYQSEVEYRIIGTDESIKSHTSYTQSESNGQDNRHQKKTRHREDYPSNYDRQSYDRTRSPARSKISDFESSVEHPHHNKKNSREYQHPRRSDENMERINIKKHRQDSRPIPPERRAVQSESSEERDYSPKTHHKGIEHGPVSGPSHKKHHKTASSPVLPVRPVHPPVRPVHPPVRPVHPPVRPVHPPVRPVHPPVRQEHQRPPPRQGNRTRRRPGANVQRQIITLQRTTHLLIPKLPFARLCREIVSKIYGNPIRWNVNSLEALHEASEQYITNIFEDATLCARHGGRVTVYPRDVHLTRLLRSHVGQW